MSRFTCDGKVGEGEESCIQQYHDLKKAKKTHTDVLSLWWKVTLNKRYLVRHGSNF